jgi:hypothetical protein
MSSLLPPVLLFYFPANNKEDAGKIRAARAGVRGVFGPKSGVNLSEALRNNHKNQGTIRLPRFAGRSGHRRLLFKVGKASKNLKNF